LRTLSPIMLVDEASNLRAGWVTGPPRNHIQIVRIADFPALPRMPSGKSRIDRFCDGRHIRGT
jgi:hypothetical protein